MNFDHARYKRELQDRRAAERLDVLERECSVKDCQRLESVGFSGPFGDRTFCVLHAPMYRTHYRIIRDILSI